jgi:glycyl-tRNA synthetase beta chain
MKLRKPGKRTLVKPSAPKKVDLLFEIGAEEIPAGMLPKAEEDLRLGLEKLLAAEGLADGVVVEAFAAPRRLVAHARGLLAEQ